MIDPAPTEPAEQPQPKRLARVRNNLARRWSPKPDDENEFPFSVEELEARLTTENAELAADILEEAQATSERMVEGRVESVERRAATLQGMVAIAGTFVLTGGTLLITQVQGAGWRGATGLLLLGSVACFALCGLRATQASSERRRWSIPARHGIFQRPEDSVAVGRVVRAASLLHSAGKNSSKARLKTTLLNKAVGHLQHALILLVVLAALLVAYAVFKGSPQQQSHCKPAATQTTKAGSSGQAQTAC